MTREINVESKHVEAVRKQLKIMRMRMRYADVIFHSKWFSENYKNSQNIEDYEYGKRESVYRNIQFLEIMECYIKGIPFIVSNR